MRTLALLLLTLCLGCEAPPAEPLQPFETCTVPTQATQRRPGTLELGHVEDTQFTPFTDGEEVEVGPSPLGQWFFTGAGLRLSGVGDVGATVCAQVDLVLAVGEYGQTYLLHRASDGGYVGRVPLRAGARAESYRAMLMGTSTFRGELLEGSSDSTRVTGALQGTITLVPVNREGFLGVPREAPPDAGTPTGPGVLDLGLPGLITVRPGEDIAVVVSVSSTQPREAVTLAVEGLPPDVTLAFAQATLGPTVDQVVARLSVAASVGPATLPFRLTATGATSSGARDGVINVVPATEREVALAAFPTGTRVALGEELAVEVHLAPLGGFSGPVSLVAEAPPGVDVTFPAMPLALTAPTDVTVRVRQRGPDAVTLRLHAVAGRDAWSPPFAAVSLGEPLPPVRSHVVLLPGFSERRVVTPGQPLPWVVRTWGLTPDGSMQRAALTVSGGPADCEVLGPDAGVVVSTVVEVRCDAGTEGGAEAVTMTSTTPGASATETWRLVVPGSKPGREGFGVAPEARPQALDGEWPRAAGLRNDLFLLGVESSDFGFATVGYDGGFPAAPVDGLGDGVRVVTVGQAASLRAVSVTRLQGRFFIMGTLVGGPTNARGPFDAVGHWNGSVWAATGAGTRAWVGHHDGTSWVDDGAALPEMPGLTDLALAVQNQVTVLVTAEPQLVVRRLQGGTWTTLPALPASLVPPPKTMRTTGRAVLGVVLDAAAQPVVALITPGDEVQVYRLEGGAWARLGGLSPTPGLLPLSLSMAVNPLSADPNLRLTLVVHEATQALAVRSGQRVLPAHAAVSRLRLFRLGASGFSELEAPGVDLARGMPEHPHVTFDGDGRPLVSFVEDGRVFVQRAMP